MSLARIVCTLAACGLLATPGFSSETAGRQGKGMRARQVAEAGADYKVQGEYTGKMDRYGEAFPVGLQVVALGKGRFKAVGYRGGLPGAGWDGSEKAYLEGRTAGERTVLASTDESVQALGEAFRVNIQGRKADVLDGSGGVVAKLKKIARKSPTLGKKPPRGAVVLFDGTTTENFKTKRGMPVKMTGDKLLVLQARSGGLETRKQFQSCKLHLEFLLPFEPTHSGQGRSNSGCYLQGRYEVQILDSFGEKGRQNECGGMYSSGVDPEVNMCFPPLTWQTFDIDFTAAKFDGDKKVADARLTVHHNGVRVYLNQKIGHTTTAAPVGKEGPNASYLYLQDHGHDLWFRNIWLVEK